MPFCRAWEHMLPGAVFSDRSVSGIQRQIDHIVLLSVHLFVSGGIV